MTYRRYFDDNDRQGQRQFFDSVAGQVTTRTMSADDKGLFVKYQTRCHQAQYDFNVSWPDGSVLKMCKTAYSEEEAIQELRKCFLNPGLASFELVHELPVRHFARIASNALDALDEGDIQRTADYCE